MAVRASASSTLYSPKCCPGPSSPTRLAQQGVGEEQGEEPEGTPCAGGVLSAWVGVYQDMGVTVVHQG